MLCDLLKIHVFIYITMITERILKMIERAGFIELFWEEVKLCPSMTYEEVYERLEREYMCAIGARRYANYDSFRRRRDSKSKR